MARALYLTHPEVNIDPGIAVPDWGLSATGRARAEAMAARNLFAPDIVFVSSTERKALELAEILAKPGANRVISNADFGENDRSATGFLPPEEFEAMANRFFAQPAESIEGWERAINAQARIVAAVTASAASYADAALVFCGHGGVGTLLKCHVAGRAIARSEDQPGPGGGNCFAFDLAQKALICEWTPMETWTGFEQ